MEQKVGSIKSIWIYPVKSMVGSLIPQATLTKDGLEGDRQWTLWDEIANHLVGGKQFKNIMQLAATFSYPNNFNNKPDVKILFPDGKAVASDSPYLNELLSAFIGHPVSLKYKPTDKQLYLINSGSLGNDKVRQKLGMPPTDSLKNLATFPISTSLQLAKYMTRPKQLHDVYPLHFITTNTLEWLQKEHPQAEIDARRFRPNFLIDTAGISGDYPESHWQEGYLEIGNTVIKVGVPTIRCSMPAQAQRELKQDIEVAKAIQTTAKQFVGSYGFVIESGKILEGDAVIYRPAKKIWQIKAQLARKIREPIVTSIVKIEDAIQRKTKLTSLSVKQRIVTSGFEAFKVVKIVEESANVKSFYLQGKNFYSFLPGQHLLIGLDIPDYPNPVIRAYSISNYDPVSKTYRISVKREDQHALVSNYLHDKIAIGNTIYSKRPKGQFFLHPQETRSVALISIGIGVTPFIAMLGYAQRTNRNEKISLIHGYKNPAYHPFRKEVQALIGRANVEIYTCYSEPSESDSDYQKKGRIDIHTIKAEVNSTDTLFYLCGTDEFMRELYWDLIEWGVKPEDIFYEQFSKSSPIDIVAGDIDRATYKIHFTQSDLKATWSNDSNLLDLAETNGLKPNFGCRYGLCEACEVKLKSGSITYNDAVPKNPSDGKLLLCCAIPTSNLEIEL